MVPYALQVYPSKKIFYPLLLSLCPAVSPPSYKINYRARRFSAESLPPTMTPLIPADLLLSVTHLPSLPFYYLRFYNNFIWFHILHIIYFYCLCPFFNNWFYVYCKNPFFIVILTKKPPE